MSVILSRFQCVKWTCNDAIMRHQIYIQHGLRSDLEPSGLLPDGSKSFHEPCLALNKMSYLCSGGSFVNCSGSPGRRYRMSCSEQHLGGLTVGLDHRFQCSSP